jgi:hypothetical protein
VLDKADTVVVSYFDGYAVGRVNDLIRGFPQDWRLLLWYHNNGVVELKMPDDSGMLIGSAGEYAKALFSLHQFHCTNFIALISLH